MTGDVSPPERGEPPLPLAAFEPLLGGALPLLWPSQTMGANFGFFAAWTSPGSESDPPASALSARRRSACCC